MSMVANLFVDVASGNADLALQRYRRKAIIYGIVALLVLSAYGAGLVGLGMVLFPIYGPAATCFLIAIGALAGAALFIVGDKILERIERRKRRRQNRALVASTQAIAPALLQSDSPMSLIAAGAIGYFANEYLHNGLK